MSKTIPVALAAHYALASTHLAHALKITRTDGAVFAFTSADADVTLSSVLHRSAPGLNVTSIALSAGFAVDNLELATLDDGSTFTRAEVLGGVWRNAKFTLAKYNQLVPADGIDVLITGTLGEVQLQSGMVTAELRGLQQYLQQPVGNVSSKTCRSRLGDSLCGVNLSTYTYNGSITSITNNQVFRDSAMISGSPGDADYASVSLLLHGNGVNGSTTFLDNSPAARTVTPFGNAQISTAQSKWGGASMAFDGSGDYLTVPNDAAFAFGAGNFTIEGWVYLNSVTGIHSILCYSRGAGPITNYAYELEINGTTPHFYAFVGSTAYDCTGGSVAINTWTHFAWVRSGTNLLLFIGGVLSSTVAIGAAVLNDPATAELQIGIVNGTGPADGFMDDIRITKGIARYTATFTPPAGPYLDGLPVTTYPADWAGEGKLTFTTGACAGQSQKVKSQLIDGTFTLSLPMYSNLTVGDAFSVVAGCRKRLAEDCFAKFDNVPNFQGEPHLPGIDNLTAPPT